MKTLKLNHYLAKINKNINSAFSKFENHLDISDLVPAYWYHEMRTKTFVTLALAKVSNGHLLQEPALQRNTQTSTSCRADYYVRIDKISLLIEVKQTWVTPNSLLNPKSFYNRINKDLSNQLKDIKSSDWGQDYILGLSVVPIYSNKKSADRFLGIDTYIRNIILNKNPNILQVDYFSSDLFHDDAVTIQNKTNQYYHGYFLIWMKK